MTPSQTNQTRPTSIINDVPLHVPPEFAGILPVSPCDVPFDFEAPAWRGLQMCLKPGGMAIDVGASYGVLTTLIASIVGPKGLIVAVEPVTEARELARYLHNSNFPQVPLLGHTDVLADRCAWTTFFRIPGLHSTASTLNREILKTYGGATPLCVATSTLDAMELNPDLIKIDVEGAEYIVLRGATRTIERYHPALVIETHHKEIDGIGGNLAELCAVLATAGYGLTDLRTMKPISAGEYAEKYSDSIGYVLAKVQE